MLEEEDEYWSKDWLDNSTGLRHCHGVAEAEEPCVQPGGPVHSVAQR